jgi:hypothetical protein
VTERHTRKWGALVSIYIPLRHGAALVDST